MLTGVTGTAGFRGTFKGGVESAGFAPSGAAVASGVAVSGADTGFVAGVLFTIAEVTERRIPTKERPSEVKKKRAAQMAVNLLKKVTAPRPPNALVAAPPPRAAPIPASFPGCSKMTKIMNTQRKTCTIVTKVSM